MISPDFNLRDFFNQIKDKPLDDIFRITEGEILDSERQFLVGEGDIVPMLTC